MKLKLPSLFLYLLGIIFSVNLLQGHYTELIFDEAYYWYYAQEMAWGYFDHPPMVALLIKIGSFFFKGELGVRFMSSVLSAGTILVLWKIVDNPGKNGYVLHFFVLVLSMTLLHAYGFLTLPDTPLLFFTALFLLLYKKFLEAPGAVLGIGLGVVMAALMYSKYHAILVIVFVLISNLRLLRNKYAWLAVMVSLICYIPHLVWLYQNDFISIKYHLYERPNGPYDFEKYTLGYFLNLVTLFGFTFPWIYQALFRTKPTDTFTKTLLYITYGILLFFFISSFNRRVQTQWLIVVCIPLVIVVFRYMLQHPGNLKWILRAGVVNLLILAYLRVGLIYEPLFPVLYETHGNKRWVSAIAKEAGDTPVVFENSYRNAPMYSYYSGHTAYSLNNLRYRQNQYTINGSESKVQHRKVLYITEHPRGGALQFERLGGEKLYGNYIDNFESFRKLRCFMEDLPISGYGTEQTFTVFNPYDIDIELQKLSFGVAYLNQYRQVEEIQNIRAAPDLEDIEILKAGDSTQFSFTLPRPRLTDPRYLKLTISENGLYWGLNGFNIAIQ